jgi:hypothetical protein
MSNKSLFKKFVKGSPPKAEPKPPREAKDINLEYTSLAQQLGAKAVEAESVKRQQQYLINKIDELGAEMAERNKLDAETKPKEQSANAEESKAADANPV